MTDRRRFEFFLCSDIHLFCRAKFESHCSEAFGKCCDIVFNLLKENNFEANEIDKVNIQKHCLTCPFSCMK